MANNILEQFGALYSRWSIAEKMGKAMQLENMWRQLSSSYNYLCQIYQQRGYLTPDETSYANQLSQMLAGLQAQKMQVDQVLSEEMMNHLAKMGRQKKLPQMTPINTKIQLLIDDVGQTPCGYVI